MSLENNRLDSALKTRIKFLAAGLKGYKARRKPWISDTNKKGRYEWALKYRNFTTKISHRSCGQTSQTLRLVRQELAIIKFNKMI